LFGKNKLNVHFGKRLAIAPEPVKNTLVNRDPEYTRRPMTYFSSLVEAMVETTKMFKDFESAQLNRVADGM
jgi:hypothetical protein